MPVILTRCRATSVAAHPGTVSFGSWRTDFEIGRSGSGLPSHAFLESSAAYFTVHSHYIECTVLLVEPLMYRQNNSFTFGRGAVVLWASLQNIEQTHSRTKTRSK